MAIEELETLLPSNGWSLYVRGDLGEDRLPDALRSRGALVDVAIVYATRKGATGPLPEDDRATLVVFASPSAVHNFGSLNACAGDALAIGTTTARAASAAGFNVHVAASTDVDALAREIRGWVVEHQGAPLPPLQSVPNVAPPMSPPHAIESILQAVGQTPLVRLRQLERPDGPRLFAKCEYLGPGNSISIALLCRSTCPLIAAATSATAAGLVTAGGSDAVISMAMVYSATGIR